MSSSFRNRSLTRLYSPKTSFVSSSSPAWLSRSRDTARALCSRSSSEIPDSVNRAWRVPPNPSASTSPAMAMTILSRRPMIPRLWPQPVLAEIGAHLADRVVDAVVGDDEPVNHQAAQEFPSRRIFIHCQEELTEFRFQLGVQAVVDHDRADAEGPPLFYHPDLLHRLRLHAAQVVEDQAVHRSPSHNPLGHGTDRAVVGIGEDRPAEEGVRALAHTSQLIEGSHAPGVREGVGEGE